MTHILATLLIVLSGFTTVAFANSDEAEEHTIPAIAAGNSELEEPKMAAPEDEAELSDSVDEMQNEAEAEVMAGVAAQQAEPEGAADQPKEPVEEKSGSWWKFWE